MKNFHINSYDRLLVWRNNLPFLLFCCHGTYLPYLWCSEHLCRLNPPLQDDIISPHLRNWQARGRQCLRDGKTWWGSNKEGGWELWRLTIERKGCILETGRKEMERMVMPGVGGENACPFCL